MLREIESVNSLFRNIPIYLSRYGLRTWERDGQTLFRQTNDVSATRVR
jgi:hypothetical protein